jgi:2-polyprenyl-3-methyl-5-hydroxy-6-metoxy-1,4-benzoquinol methylase
VTAASEDADVETSSEGYARRFAGPVGRWFLDLQARTTVDLVSRWPRASVLDVGGGHAQIAEPLARAGCAVTVFGSDPRCAGRLEASLDAGRIRFSSGPLLHLPFPDRSFDVVTCFRLLPHTERWRDLAAELARVARCAVVVDYPTRRSVNAVSSLFFGLKKSVEGNTRPFRVFGDAEIREAFLERGFVPTARRPQFFLPMALHRAHGSRAAARLLEGVAGALALTRAMGSPVILRLEPRG